MSDLMPDTDSQAVAAYALAWDITKRAFHWTDLSIYEPDQIAALLTNKFLDVYTAIYREEKLKAESDK